MRFNWYLNKAVFDKTQKKQKKKNKTKQKYKKYKATEKMLGYICQTWF